MTKVFLCFLYVLAITEISFAQVDSTDELNLDDAPALQPAVVNAAPVIYSIKQIVRSKNIVIIEASAVTEFRAGKIFLATFADGKQCSLDLQESNGKIMAFDSSDCNQGQSLTLSNPVEPALLVETPTLKPAAVPRGGKSVTTASANKAPGRFSASVYYSVANQVIFKNAQVDSGSGTGTIEAAYETGNSMGFGASYMNVEDNSWGLTGSLLYEPRRKVSSLTMKGPGGTYNNTFSTRPEVALFLVEAGIVHRWNKAYVPLSINYSVPSLTYSSNSEIWDITGYVGGQLGFGYLLSQNSAWEIFMRAIGLKATATDGSTSVDFGNGYLTGLGLGYKYYF